MQWQREATANGKTYPYSGRRFSSSINQFVSSLSRHAFSKPWASLRAKIKCSPHRIGLPGPLLVPVAPACNDMSMLAVQFEARMVCTHNPSWVSSSAAAGNSGCRRKCSTQRTNDKAHSCPPHIPGCSLNWAVVLFLGLQNCSLLSPSRTRMAMIRCRILLCAPSMVFAAVGLGVHMLYLKLPMPLDNEAQNFSREVTPICLHVSTREFLQKAASQLCFNRFLSSSFGSRCMSSIGLKLSSTAHVSRRPLRSWTPDAHTYPCSSISGRLTLLSTEVRTASIETTPKRPSQVVMRAFNVSTNAVLEEPSEPGAWTFKSKNVSFLTCEQRDGHGQCLIPPPAYNEHTTHMEVCSKFVMLRNVSLSVPEHSLHLSLISPNVMFDALCIFCRVWIIRWMSLFISHVP